MKVNSNIFKKYDVRGLYPDEIDEAMAYKIAGAFYSILGGKGLRIAVGREDDPQSSLKMRDKIVKGIIEQGCDVIDIGFSSSPALYFAVCSMGCDGGIQITASHLPANYTGMKLVRQGAVPISMESGLEQIQRMSNVIKKADRIGRIEKKDIAPEYIKGLRAKIGDWPKLKIVMDAGNGMTGLYLKEIFKGTMLEIVPLFWEIDGTFPNRGANVKLAQNREPLQKKIIEVAADMGFMWDGDGDRFYVLDNRGEVIDPNFVLLLIGEYLLKKGDKVVVDIRTAGGIRKELEKLGTEVIVSKSWHTEVKKKMRESGAIFGSETSGHYMFKDFYFIDDGILASIYFLNAISILEGGLESKLMELRSKFHILPERNFKVQDADQAEKILKQIGEYYRKKGAQVSAVDGISVELPNWSFNLRKSATEPLLRLNMEADSKEFLNEKSFKS